MEKQKIRISLLVGSIIVFLADMLFLWLLNLNEIAVIQRNLLLSMSILSVIAIIALVLFFIKGPVFQLSGEIDKNNILAMLIAMLLVIQVAYSFVAYTQKDLMLKNEMYHNIRSCIVAVEAYDYKNLEDYDTVLEQQVNEYIAEVNIVNTKEEMTYSTKTQTSYTYPFQRDLGIQIITDTTYINNQMRKIASDLLTVVIISIFFSVEIVLLMIKFITEKKGNTAQKHVQEHVEKPMALSYVRQIAFLFYFSSRLSASFLPMMAKSFQNTAFGITQNGAAGIPQSFETLFTCIAIFITTEILRKKGWKAPFVIGLSLVAGGTFASAMSPNFVMFIASRTVVGLGYGFCWMTLRHFALFGRNNEEQIWGFSMLNAGLYAGMNCGVSVGAILAESIGYRNVFWIAGGLTLLCSLVIIRMENMKLEVERKENEEELTCVSEKVHFSFGEKLHAVLFSLLLIAPSCIAVSYFSYFLPLYFEEIGRSVSDVGRAQLLYGIVIVYIGPKLSEVLLKRSKNLLRMNYLYNFIVAVGILLVGIQDGVFVAMIAALCLGIADSFGFGVQNNYFLSLAPIKKMGVSKSLSYLSFMKKMMEMMGPTVFAVVIIIGFERGVFLLGCIFLVAIALFIGIKASVQREVS